MRKRPSVLTIAGSDSGGGAGIQADLKTFAWFGLHGSSAITAITAQNSREVTAVFPLPDGIVEAQIDAVMSDLRPSVVKIGMLGTKQLVKTVARKLREWRPPQIVLDPVMIASSGARLLTEDAVAALRAELLPLATVLTPNWPEAAELIGEDPGETADIASFASRLSALGSFAIVLKGGHLPGSPVVDTLVIGDGVWEYRHERIADAEGHGTGCALASAVAANLALGKDLPEAVAAATDFVHQALLDRYSTGSSKENYLGILAEPSGAAGRR